MENQQHMSKAAKARSTSICIGNRALKSVFFLGTKLYSKPFVYSFMDIGSFFRDGKILAIGFSFLTQHLLPPLQQYV